MELVQEVQTEAETEYGAALSPPASFPLQQSQPVRPLLRRLLSLLGLHEAQEEVEGLPPRTSFFALPGEHATGGFQQPRCVI